MAVAAAGYSVIVRNQTIDERYPGGMLSYQQACPNQTFCTDGILCRVGFMAFDDADMFRTKLVAIGMAASLEEAGSVIAITRQQKGPVTPCDWLTIAYDGTLTFAWLVGSDRGAVIASRTGEKDLEAPVVVRENLKLDGHTEGGRVGVYRDKATAEKLFIARPFSPSRRWWEFWKIRQQRAIQSDNYKSVFEEARDLMKPYMRWQPGNPALSGSARHRIERARDMFRRITEFNGSDWGAWYLYGLANKLSQEYAIAYASLHRAYAMNGKDARVAGDLAIICMVLGKGDEAAKITREMVARNPTDAGVLSDHAMALLLSGAEDEAHSAVQQALAMDPNDAVTQRSAELIDDVRQRRRERPDRWPPT